MEQFYQQVATAEELELQERLTRRTFLILEKAWQPFNQHLVDFKTEFARYDGGIGLGDVLDSDSWRKTVNGQYADKQIFRDGGPMEKLAAKLLEAAELSGQFRLPQQQVVLWRGSEKDDLTPFTEVLTLLSHPSVTVKVITSSAHKEPVQSYQCLQAAIQGIPDSVIITDAGMSNALGATTSANCSAPCITVSASLEKHPEDVWSCIRNASSVPVMMVANPANAVLAGLQILAARNAALYANLREIQERRLANSLVIE